MYNKKADVGVIGRDKLVAGANYIANAVKATFGPGGQNFALEKGNKITNDGITIAQELLGSLQDETEDRGARILVDNARRTNDEVGDASTSFMILTQAVIKECLKYLPSKERIVGKLTASTLLKQLNEEKVKVLADLAELAKPVESAKEMIDIAMVSAEDKTLGVMLGQMQWELGPEGFILAEETPDKECSIEKVNGLLLDNGFGSSAIINVPEKEALEVRDVAVIYTNYTIDMPNFAMGEDGSMTALLEVINNLVKRGKKDIVLMSRGFTQAAVQHMLNQQQSGINLYPLNAPYTDQVDVMYDLQAVLGGRFINSDVDSLDDLQLSDVGHASHILAKRMSTVLAGKDNEEAVKDRIKVLEDKLKASGSEFEKRTLVKRIAQLKGGLAIIKIGGQSEAERKYLKDKADDAVNAVRAALQGGTVKGGGQALFDIAQGYTDDVILKAPLQSLFLQLKSNAGDDFVIEDWIRDSVTILSTVVERAVSTGGILATAVGAVSTKKPSDIEEVLAKIGK